MEPPPMNDTPANDIEKAIQKLVEEIRQERIPERILTLSRELQVALDLQEAKSNGSGTD